MAQQPPSTATARAAEYLANLDYQSLPSEVVATVKAILLDTLGTSLAATTLGAGCAELVSVARAAGGAQESTILGFGDKVPAHMAAFVNGGLAHALNYDAVGAAHLGIIPPAPLAVAERRGGVSGRELIAAIAAGCELSARLGAGIGGGHPTALLGQVLSYFGTAAASARVMRLSPSGMHSAIGLALMQAAGMRQVVIEGDPPSKAIYGSFPNQGGVLSALLAQQGLRSECEAIDGEAGVLALVAHDAIPRPTIDTDFGSRFYLLEATFKPWPVSGHVTPFIEAALEIARDHSLKAEDIAHVRLRAAPAVRAWFEPTDKRKRPETSPAAANSVYFAVAKALVNGQVGLGDFTPAGITQPAALAFGERMDHTIEDGPLETGSIEISTVGGELYTVTCAVTSKAPLGSPSRPMGWEQLVDKLRDCARYAARRIPRDALEETVQLIARLENLPDVSVIPGLLSRYIM